MGSLEDFGDTVMGGGLLSITGAAFAASPLTTKVKKKMEAERRIQESIFYEYNFWKVFMEELWFLGEGSSL